jgi:RIO kinase 1
MSTEDERLDLSRPAFLRGQLEDAERHVIEHEFGTCVGEVLGKVNDGKEATVYLCRVRPGTLDAEYVAAKMYRARKFRAFASDAHYTNPARMRDRRMAKAMTKRTRKGVHMAHHQWIEREWDALQRLHAAGASVPTPYLCCSDGILMEFLGDGIERAPALVETRLSGTELESAWHAVHDDIEILLACGLVHGDLSAYNILYAGGRPRLIDLPQALAIDDAPDPWALFFRDVSNVCDWFNRRGMTLDALDVALRLWRG